MRAFTLGLLGLVIACSGSASNAAGPFAPGFGDAGADATAPGADGKPDASGSGWRARSSVRIATYNVQNFFDTECDSGRCASADYEQAPSAGAFDAKAASISMAIARLNADVVLLQEVEKETCLVALQAKLNGAFPHQILGETGFAGSVDVGVLSKDPIVAVRTHRRNRFTLSDGRNAGFLREFLEVDLDHKGAIYTVFVAHFKAKRDDDALLRLGEATEARRIILAHATAYPGRLIVMGGDLNDTPNSAPIGALTGAAGLLLAELRDIQEPESYTEFSRGMGSSIDHLLVPATQAERHLRASTRVLKDAPNRGLGGSDHAGLVAEFAVVP
jgi:uncharacterized protein